MKVKDLVYRDISAVRNTDAFGRVIKIMRRTRQNIIFVVDNHNEYIGSISISDLIAAALPNYMKSLNSTAYLPALEVLTNNLYEMINNPIADYITPDLPVLDPEDNLEHAADLMNRSNRTVLPVLDSNRLIGRLNKIDILSLALTKISDE